LGSKAHGFLKNNLIYRKITLGGDKMKRFWSISLILVMLLLVGCETIYTPSKPEPEYNPVSEIHLLLKPMKSYGKTNFIVEISGTGFKRIEDNISIYGGKRIRNVPVPGLYHIWVKDQETKVTVGYGQVYLLHPNRPIAVEVTVSN
jgi:hypothetical protein